MISAGGVSAHHSYVSKYDAKKKIKISGVITSVSFANPHIFFTVQASGSGASWTVETESIPKVQAKGITRARLVEGARVVVTGWPARSGAGELGLSTIRIGRRGAVTIRRRPR